MRRIGSERHFRGWPHIGGRGAGAACSLACALLCALAPVPAAAQVDVVEDAERQRVERQLEIEQAIRKAAQAAASRKALEPSATVTYEQVLADPDNLDLNFRYAQTQAARGDLPGASATLERILMINPTLTPIRLFYAMVLFRVGSLEDAEKEFNTLRDAELPEPQRQQVLRSLREIRRQRRRTHLTAGLSAGWGFDTNRNAAPSSKHRLFGNSLLDLTGTSRKRRDTHLLLLNSLAVTHDLQGQAGHQLFVTGDYFLGEQTRVDDLDLQSFAVETGAVLRTPLADLTPSGFVNYVHLSRESFLRSQGLALRADRPVGRRAALSAEGSWTQEDFLPITENLAAPERTGDRVNTVLGGRFALTPTMQVGADLGFEKKYIDGPTEYNGYDGWTMTGSHTWMPGRGQFFLSALTFDVQRYDEPDTSISAMTRRDKQLRARFTYGAPMALLIGEWLPSAVLQNLTATFSVEQTRSLSNITNYTYSNTKLGMMVTKQVEF